MKGPWRGLILSATKFVFILIFMTLNAEATSRKSYCLNKSRNSTQICINGDCDHSVGECICDKGYFGTACDKYHKSFLGESVVGVIILIPAVIWVMLRIYNRKHRVSRNSKMRKRPRRSTVRRDVESVDDDISSIDGDDPPNYTTAISSESSPPLSLLTISPSQPNQFALPTYDDVLKEKESQKEETDLSSVVNSNQLSTNI